MRTFLRSNATYKAESKQLDDDIDITDLFTEKNIVFNLPEETAFEKHIADLHERIDKLTALVNVPKKNDGASKSVVKSGATSKAGKKNDKSAPTVKKSAVKKR